MQFGPLSSVLAGENLCSFSLFWFCLFVIKLPTYTASEEHVKGRIFCQILSYITHCGASIWWHLLGEQTDLIFAVCWSHLSVCNKSSTSPAFAAGKKWFRVFTRGCLYDSSVKSSDAHFFSTHIVTAKNPGKDQVRQVNFHTKDPMWPQ